MNQSDAQTVPNFVSCPCQHCSGKIEFDANQLDTAENATVPCPHCGMVTVISAPTQNAAPVISEAPCTDEDVEDQANLGTAHFQGLGVTQDYGMAVKCFLSAAKQGHPVAQSNLGVCYFNGFGVEKNDSEACKWFRKAAEQGLANSQYDLGLCYYNGFGVEKNQAEAVRWWRLAAEQGHVGAQFSLGNAYSSGEGTAENHVEAAKWMQRAAMQGNIPAQHYLTIVFRFGDGVPQNFIEAYKWGNLAAANGLVAAAELRDDLAQEMTSSQIEEAQLRSEVEMRRLSQAEKERDAEDFKRQPIPSAVRREVWRRDEGKCARCGSREKLEYDHIVPIARGGSNTARNIELLCESCNRSKSASIQ